MSKTIRCAIYTRKSTDEGLDQAFNSLDAQREACLAYIASQRHEGWKALPQIYDDGGYSGGTLQRPALQALLRDIAAGQVDLVVVYKIDRLTRSLTDFAKMVEVFEAQQTSFVSVTQHFNTTTSMGRLTLNVLLSFAQFEREVTGERIRNKIAASKKKGMWLGGVVPLGYDLKDKALVVNPEEAGRVRHLFERYLALGCVSQLKAELDRQGLTSKRRLRRNGEATGGVSFSRGALYTLLQNQTYLGQVHHAGQCYPGQHEAIVPQTLWDRVQARLAAQRRGNKQRRRATCPSLLAGMVRLDDGTRLTPKHTNKQGKRYRYYTAEPLKPRADDAGPRVSIPAHDLETLVEREWKALLTCADLSDPEQASELIPQERSQLQALAVRWDGMDPTDRHEYFRQAQLDVRVAPHQLTLSAQPDRILAQTLHVLAGSGEPFESPILRRTVMAKLQIVHNRKRIVDEEGATNDAAEQQQREQSLQRIALGRVWGAQLIQGEVESTKALAIREKCTESYIYDILRAGCLAPSLVKALADGKNQLSITSAKLQRPLPLSWEEQLQLFGQ